MGKIDQARGDGSTRFRRRLALLVAVAVAAAALAVAVVVRRGSEPSSTSPPPSTSPTTGTPATESAIPTKIPTVGSPPSSTRPPVVPPSSRQPTSRERYEEVARRELEQGLVAYNPPAQAQVQEDFEVTVRVQRGTATVSPSLTSLPGKAPVIVEKLPVGTYMHAELRGSGFDVQPLSEDLQLIDGLAEWAWRVTPQTDGLRTLRLTLVVELDDLPLSNRTFDRSIAVAVKEQPPWYRRAFGLLDVSGVVTAIVIAAILGSAKLGRMWWVRRNPNDTPSEESGSSDAAPNMPASTPDGPASKPGAPPDVTATTTGTKPTASANGNKSNP